MLYFCTYFDAKYLIRGLTLYRSLIHFSQPFRLFILCFDALTYEVIHKLRLPEVVPISLKDFETGDTSLLNVKSSRSGVEYYFTCTPSLPLYIFKKNPEINLLTYLDADLFFFSSPFPIYKEWGNNSVLIIGHRFPQHFRELEKAYGIYNIGFLSFRRDDIAMGCLNLWREQCLKWCRHRIDDGERFADQKYLDNWPFLSSKVIVLQNEGAGLAPWNLENYALSLANGNILVDSQPLIFFHFSGLKRIKRYLYNPCVNYDIARHSFVKKNIYSRYLRELRRTETWAAKFISQSYLHRLAAYEIGNKATTGTDILHRIVRKMRSEIYLSKQVFKGRLYLVMGRRIL
jgi:hypothetical protein